MSELLPLYQLYLLDDRLDRARKDLAALDAPLPVAAQLDKILSELSKQEAALRKCNADLKDAEMKLRSLEEKREQDKKRLYGGKVIGTRELQALEREIENLGRSIGEGEDRVLEAMNRVEPFKANVEKLQQYKKAAEEKLAAQKATQEETRKRLKADVAQTEPLRAQAVHAVEPELLQRYEQIRSRYSRPGLSVVRNASCGQCHNAVPSMVMRQLQDRQTVIQCDSCFCIFYLPQE
jgi:predicted  nucleic acid-binding Zn-ribbon protein